MRFLAACCLVAAIPLAAPGQADLLPSVPTGSLEVAVTPFATGFGGTIGGVNQIFATKMVPLGDGTGRNLVATLGGALRLVGADGSALDAPLGGPYLDTTTAQTEIAPGAYGMTTVAVHPDFGTPGADGFGKFYTLLSETRRPSLGDYDFQPAATLGNDHTEVLAEFTVAPGAIGKNRLEPGDVTRRDIFSVRQPDNEHNYGDLVFDDNGLLYITAGDGEYDFAGGGLYASTANAADPSTPFGKVLRIDPLGSGSVNGQYGVPTGPGGNVFANDGDPNTMGEVYSLGHRNPYRISYDAPTGRVVVGEVGQYNIEEVNVIENGANYGWSTVEGTFFIDPNDAFSLTLDTDVNDNGIGDFSEANGLVEPVFQYDHEEGVSVTGGFVYRGARLPELQGKYVFADLGQGGAVPPSLFAGDLDTGQFERVNVAGGRTALPRTLLSIGTDDAGEIYLMGSSGDIVTLIPPDEVPPPSLFNGSFEQNGGSLDGWTVFGNTISNVELSQTPSLEGREFDGANALRMSGQLSGGFNFTGAFQGVAIEGGERIRVGLATLVRSLDDVIGATTAELKVEYYTEFGASLGSPEFIRQEILVVADASSPVDAWVEQAIEDIAPEGAVEARVTLIFLQPSDTDLGSVYFDGLGFLAVQPGDYNADGAIDNADYQFWRSTYGQLVSTAGLGADGNRDGRVDAADYSIWRDAVAAGAAAVPEPASVASALALGVLLSTRRRRAP